MGFDGTLVGLKGYMGAGADAFLRAVEAGTGGSTSLQAPTETPSWRRAVLSVAVSPRTYPATPEPIQAIGTTSPLTFVT